MSFSFGLERIKDVAMRALDEFGLENVCDTAYALKPGFTPCYLVHTLQLPDTAGDELRVCANLVSRTQVTLHAADGDVRAATRKATRVLMVGMRDQAQKWLDDNPEEKS